MLLRDRRNRFARAAVRSRYARVRRARVDRTVSVRRQPDLASPLRQDRGGADRRVARAVRVRWRRGGGRARSRAARRVRAVHRAARRALHRRGWHLRARLRASEHGLARARHRAREHHGQDRRGHAADPSAPARQCASQARRACRRVLHLSRRECGRFAVAARRSALVPRLSEQRRLFLDDASSRHADAFSLRRATRLLRARPLPLALRRYDEPGPRARRSASTARSISRCSRRSSRWC